MIGTLITTRNKNNLTQDHELKTLLQVINVV